MPDLASMANSVAGQYGIPTNIFSALIQKESGSGSAINPSTWNPNAVGAAGELGLTQLMPGTAAGLGVTNPLDPLANLQGGASYLSQQFKKFGNWNDALAAYNGGPGNLPAGQGYAASVLGMAGVTGSSTGQPQPSPAGVPGVNAPVPGGNATPASGGSKIWYYAVAIVIILILVAFGVWGTVKS